MAFASLLPAPPDPPEKCRLDLLGRESPSLLNGLNKDRGRLKD